MLKAAAGRECFFEVAFAWIDSANRQVIFEDQEICFLNIGDS